MDRRVMSFTTPARELFCRPEQIFLNIRSQDLPPMLLMLKDQSASLPISQSPPASPFAVPGDPSCYRMPEGNSRAKLTAAVNRQWRDIPRFFFLSFLFF